MKADHLANFTMDEKRSWQKSFPSAAGRQLRDANFVVHCDGGRRGDACSAAAWILEAVWGDVSQIVSMAGVFLDEGGVVSSFVADAMALDSRPGLRISHSVAQHYNPR